jgi:hypothetical protein
LRGGRPRRLAEKAPMLGRFMKYYARSFEAMGNGVKIVDNYEKRLREELKKGNIEKAGCCIMKRNAAVRQWINEK